jgi:hypothetical protein
MRSALESSLVSQVGPDATFARNCVAYRDELLGGLHGNIVKLTEVSANEPRFCSRRLAADAFGDNALENGFAWSEELEKNSFFQEQACTWTPGAVAGPGGIRTAGSITADATDTFHLLMLDLHPTSTQIHGFSFYAKAVTQPYVACASYDIDGNYVVGFFDAVTAEFMGSHGPLLGHASEVIGGGWIRIQINYQGGIAQHTHLAFFHDSHSVTAASYTGDGSTVDGYIWGAQHAYGTDDLGQEALPEYVATFGAARRLGPRFTGLLLEEESTNYCEGSSGRGSPTHVTVPQYIFSSSAPSTTPVLCPDGVTRTTSMVEILPSPIDAWHLSYQPCIPGQINVVSFYVLSITVPWLQLFIEGPNSSIWFNLVSCAVGAQSGQSLTARDIIDVGAGWRYIYASVPNAGTSQGHYFAARSADGGSISTGMTPGDAYAFFGHQFERNRVYPSSTILTSGAAATRLAESPSYSGLVIPAGKRIQLRGEYLLDRRDESDDRTVLALSDGGSPADQIALQVLAAGNAARTVSAATGGDAGQVSGATDVVDGVAHQLRADCRQGSLRLRVDGATEGIEDAVVTLPSGLDTLKLSPPGGLVRNVLVRVG